MAIQQTHHLEIVPAADGCDIEDESGGNRTKVKRTHKVKWKNTLTVDVTLHFDTHPFDDCDNDIVVPAGRTTPCKIDKDAAVGTYEYDLSCKTTVPPPAIIVEKPD